MQIIETENMLFLLAGDFVYQWCDAHWHDVTPAPDTGSAPIDAGGEALLAENEKLRATIRGLESDLADWKARAATPHTYAPTCSVGVDPCMDMGCRAEGQCKYR